MQPQIDQLNLNQLRVFSAVFVEGSMTRAARALHLTQSGVSQHIKSLEGWMGVRLFDRAKQSLVPTHAAKLLHAAYQTGLGRMASAVQEIIGGSESLSGEVAMGMPVEFGTNMVSPVLADIWRSHPLVTFRVGLGFGSEMNEGLLSGDLDFAIVDEVRMDRRIEIAPLCDEIVDLVVSSELLQKLKGAAGDEPSLHEREFIERLPFVEYQENLPILGLWLRHHYKSRASKLRVVATVPNARNVASMVVSGMGAGVLPRHLVIQLEREGARLTRFEGCGQPLKNALGLAVLKGRTLSPGARYCIEILKKRLGS